jgi:nucleoside-diphosphate-sugar epimerase
MVRRLGVGKMFFSSSACIYNQANQESVDNPVTVEDSAYPADPDSDYGFTKLFSERVYQALSRNFGVDVKIGRFHNIFGMEGAWGNGREKAPAAMCRKVAETKDGGIIEVWGDGEQTRSFLYIDECLEAVRRFMVSEFLGPVNIGSEEMVSINQLVRMVKEVANKPEIKIRHIEGPLGVRGRNSDNRLIREKLGWVPDYPLIEGLKKTYPWIEGQVKSGKEDCPWAN